MDAILVSTVFGFGLLLVFDGLVRERRPGRPSLLLRRLAPRGVGAVVGAGVAYPLTGWPAAAALAGAVGWTVPGALTQSREERVRVERRDAIAEVAARLRDAVRSGVGIGDALARSAERAPDAIASDLRRLVAESQLSGLAEAARSFADRLRDPSAELLASALATADRVGSRNLSEALDDLAESTTAQAAVVREAKSRQTRNRLSARIVAAVPLLLLLAIRRANPGYLEPFATPAGQMVMALALSLIWVGYAAMRRAARVEGGAR